MIRKRTILSLALLATTAACGGGGGDSSAAGPAPAVSGGPAPTSGASTNFNNPSVVASTDANGNIGAPAMAADRTSQTATLTQGDGTADNPTTLRIKVPGMGIDHTFNTSANQLALDGTVKFNGADIFSLGGSSIAMFKDGKGGVLVTDNSGQLSFSNYGIWANGDSDLGQKVTAVGAIATGVETPASDLASQQGTLTYHGSSVATGTLNGQHVNWAGTLDATVDPSKRTVQVSTDMHEGGGGPDRLSLATPVINMTDGTTRFAGTITSTSTSTVVASGTTAGSCFGPGCAEIGGVLNVSGPNNSAIGAYGGAKTR